MVLARIRFSPKGADRGKLMLRRRCWKRRSERKRLSAMLPFVTNRFDQTGLLTRPDARRLGAAGDTRHLPLPLEVLQQPQVVVNGLA